MERDNPVFRISGIQKISTHTLTWSVTSCGVLYSSVLLISTHTLTWSVTINGYDSVYMWVDFNSHAHVERDALVVEKFYLTFQFQLTRSRGA